MGINQQILQATSPDEVISLGSTHQPMASASTLNRRKRLVTRRLTQLENVGKKRA